jgi:hypothetical protein
MQRALERQATGASLVWHMTDLQTTATLVLVLDGWDVHDGNAVMLVIVGEK